MQMRVRLNIMKIDHHKLRMIDYNITIIVGEQRVPTVDSATLNIVQCNTFHAPHQITKATKLYSMSIKIAKKVKA